jgi:hypothetical protein
MHESTLSHLGAQVPRGRHALIEGCTGWDFHTATVACCRGYTLGFLALEALRTYRERGNKVPVGCQLVASCYTCMEHVPRPEAVPQSLPHTVYSYHDC